MRGRIVISGLDISQGGKTRQDLLNDIIAKSKERKLDKARGKEDQESERERLDEGMGELLGMLNRRPNKSEDDKRQRSSDEYDIMMRVSCSCRGIGFVLLADS